MLLSIVAQGLTIGPMLKRLGIIGAHSDRQEIEAARAGLAASAAAQAELDGLVARHGIPASIVEELRAEYATRHQAAAARLHAAHVDGGAIVDEERRRARRHLLMVERTRLRDLLNEGLLSEDASHRLLADVDARLRALDEPGETAPAPTAPEAATMTATTPPAPSSPPTMARALPPDERLE